VGWAETGRGGDAVAVGSGSIILIQTCGSSTIHPCRTHADRVACSTLHAMVTCTVAAAAAAAAAATKVLHAAAAAAAAANIRGTTSPTAVTSPTAAASATTRDHQSCTYGQPKRGLGHRLVRTDQREHRRQAGLRVHRQPQCLASSFRYDRMSCQLPPARADGDGGGRSKPGGGTAPLVNKLEVTLNTPGTHTYACEIGSHCTAGQVSLG
jgi:hypothetical protein